MSLFDQLGGVLSSVMSGNLSEQETHAHYDQIAQAVPQQTLGAAMGPALDGVGPDEAQRRITNSAQQMTPQQRGGMMQQLLGGLGSSSGLDIGSLLSQLGINPAVAQNPQSATPAEVGVLASHAQATNPGLFQEAMSFYSQHPTLVKSLGAMVIAQIASQLGRNQS